MTFSPRALLRRLGKPAAPPAPPAPPPGAIKARFDLTATTNELWRASERGYRITVPPKPMLDGATKIFTIGSCFAMEIRHALERRSFDVYPKYRRIEFDSANQRLGSMPAHDDIAHYDTFTIRQEFEHAFADTHFASADFLQHKHKLTNHFAVGGRTSWQDPYRKKIFAADENHILDLSRKIDACISRAFAAPTFM
ncbi:MAG: GSCFA domain-containing protein [Alphaproteobacteria bacterium]